MARTISALKLSVTTTIPTPFKYWDFEHVETASISCVQIPKSEFCAPLRVQLLLLLNIGPSKITLSGTQNTHYPRWNNTPNPSSKQLSSNHAWWVWLLTKMAISQLIMVLFPIRKKFCNLHAGKIIIMEIKKKYNFYQSIGPKFSTSFVPYLCEHGPRSPLQKVGSHLSKKWFLTS